MQLLNYSLCLSAPSLLTGDKGLCTDVWMTGSLESPTQHRQDFSKVTQNPLLDNLPHAVVQDHRQLVSWGRGCRRDGEGKGRKAEGERGQEESQVRF